MKIIPNEEFIAKNFNKTIEIINEHGSVGINQFFNLEWVQERYMFCPASSRKDFFSAFPGGLACHNLFVFHCIKKLAEIMYPGKFNMNVLCNVSFLHSIGKLGTKQHEYYIKQISDWHINKGMYYEINSEIQYMKIPQRSLYLTQFYNIDNLLEEEYLAILLQDGNYDSENNSYRYKKPELAMLLQHASEWAIKKEKENVVVWP